MAEAFVWPLRDLVLMRVLEEDWTNPAGLELPERSHQPDDHRSLQGEVVRFGIDCQENQEANPDGVLAEGDRVLFDDNGCKWWRGEDPTLYFPVLLGDEAEYVLVPECQILMLLEDADGEETATQPDAA